MADKTNSKVEPEGVDDVLDKFLEKVNSRVSTAIFAYDTKRAELALWEKDNHQVESELEILKCSHI